MAGSTSVVVVGAALTLLVCPTVADPSRRLNPMRPKAFDFAAEAESVVGELNANFTCDDLEYGYYADQSHKCQVFHICMPITTATGRTLDTFQFSFFCPNQTRFSQDSRTCIDEERAYPCHKAHMLYDLNKNIGKRPAKKKRPVDPKAAVVGAHRFSSSVNSGTEETKSSFASPEESGNAVASFSSHFSSREPDHDVSELNIGEEVVPASHSASSSGSSEGSLGFPASRGSSSSQFSLSAGSNDQPDQRHVGSTRAKVSNVRTGHSEHTSGSRGRSQHTTHTGSTEPILPSGAQIFPTVSINSQNALSDDGHARDDTTGNIVNSASTSAPFFSSSSHGSSGFSGSRTLTTPGPSQLFTTSRSPALRGSDAPAVSNLRSSSVTGSIPFSSGSTVNSIQGSSTGFAQRTPLNAHALITAAQNRHFDSEQSVEGSFNNQGSLVTDVASGSGAGDFAQTAGSSQGSFVSSRGRAQSASSGSVNIDSNHISEGSINRGSATFTFASSGNHDPSPQTVTPQPAIFVGQSVAPTRHPTFNHQPASPTHQPASPTHQPVSSSHQPAPSTHQPAIFTHRPTSSTHQPASIHQPASPTHQPASPARQPAIFTHQPVSPTHQPASPTHQPVIFTHQPASPTNQPPTHQPASTRQPLTHQPTGAPQPISSSPRLQTPGFSAGVIRAEGGEERVGDFFPTVHHHSTSGVIPTTTPYYDEEESYDAFVTTEVPFEAERDFNDAQFSGSREGFDSSFSRGSSFSGSSVVATTSSAGLSGFSASQKIQDSSGLIESSRSSLLHGSRASLGVRGSGSFQGSSASLSGHGSESFQRSGSATEVHGSTNVQGSGASAGVHGSTPFQGSGTATGARGSTNFQVSGASTSGHGSAGFRGSGASSEIRGSTNIKGSGTSSDVHGPTNLQGSGAPSGVRAMANSQGFGVSSGVRGSIDFQGSNFSDSGLGSNLHKSSTSLGHRSKSSQGFGVSSSALSHSQESNSVSGFSDESHRFESSVIGNGGLSTSSNRSRSHTVGSSRGTNTDVRGSFDSGNERGSAAPSATRGSVSSSGFRGSTQHSLEETLPGGNSLASSMDRGHINAFSAAAAAEAATAKAAAAIAAAKQGFSVSANTKSNFTVTRNRGKKKFQPSPYLIQSSDWTYQSFKDVSHNIQRGTQRHVSTRGRSGVSKAVSTNSINHGISHTRQELTGAASQADNAVDTSSKFGTNIVSSYDGVSSVQSFQGESEASGQEFSSTGVPASSNTHSLSGSSRVRGSAPFSGTQRSSPSSRIRGSSLAATASQTSSESSRLQESSNVQRSSTSLHGSNASSRVRGSLGSISTQHSGTKAHAQEHLRTNAFGATSLDSFSSNRLATSVEEPTQSEDYFTTTEFESEFTTESNFVEENENVDTIPTTYRPEIAMSFDFNQAVSNSRSRELASRGSSDTFASNSLTSVQNSRRRGPGHVTPSPAVSSVAPSTPKESPHASASTNIQVSEHTLQHNVNTSPSKKRVPPAATTTAASVHVGSSPQVGSRRRGTTSRGTQSQRQHDTQSTLWSESPESDAQGSEAAAEHGETGQTSIARKVIKKKIVVNGRPGSRGSQEQSTTEPSIVASDSQDEEEKKHRLALEALAKFNPALANARILSVKFTKNVKNDRGKTTTADNITKETIAATSSVGSSRSFGSQRGNSGQVSDIVTTTPVTTTQSSRVRSPKNLRPITVQKTTVTTPPPTPPSIEVPTPVTTTQSLRVRSPNRFRPIINLQTTLTTTTQTEATKSITTQPSTVRSPRRFRPITVQQTTTETTTPLSSEVPTVVTTTQPSRVRSSRRFRPITGQKTTAETALPPTESSTPITTTQSSRVSSRERFRPLRAPQTTATPTTEAPTPVTLIPTPSQRSRISGRRTTTRKESSNEAENEEATTIASTAASRSTESSSKQLQSQTRGNERTGNTSTSRRKILKKVTPISHESTSLKVANADSASSSTISRSSASSASSSSSNSAISSSSTRTEDNFSSSLQSSGIPPGQSLRVFGTSVKSSVSQVSTNENTAAPSSFSSSSIESGISRSNARRVSRPNTKDTSRKTLNNAEEGTTRVTHNPLTDLELEALSDLANVSTSLGSTAKKSAGILPNVLPEAEAVSKTTRINSRRSRPQTSRGRSRTPSNSRR